MRWRVGGVILITVHIEKVKKSRLVSPFMRFGFWIGLKCFHARSDLGEFNL